MNSTWKIIFKGEVLPNFTVETAKTNFAHLFKMPLEQVNQLFSGKEFILKSEVAYEQVPSILSSFEKRGLIVHALSNETSLSQTYTNNTDNNIYTTQNNGTKNSHSQAEPLSSTAITDIEAHNGFSVQDKRHAFGQSNHYTNNQHNGNLYTHQTTNNLDKGFASTPSIISFSFQGRWGRLSFINAFTLGLGILIFSQILCFIILFIVDIASFKNRANATNFLSSGIGLGLLAFGIIIYITAFIWFIRISVLRLHDLNWSGWWSLLIALFCFVPALYMPMVFINLLGYIAIIVVYFCLLGTKDENYYGPPLSQGSPIGLIIFGVIGIPYLSIMMFLMIFIAGISLLSS